MGHQQIATLQAQGQEAASPSIQTAKKLSRMGGIGQVPVQGIAALFISLLPFSCASPPQTICMSDGGLNPTPEPCSFPFTYTSTVVFDNVDIYFTIPAASCLSTEEYPPYMPDVLVQSPSSVNDTTKWCATIAAYSTQDEQQRLRWGYCNCINSTTAFPTLHPTTEQPTTQAPIASTLTPSSSPSAAPTESPITTFEPTWQPTNVPTNSPRTPTFSPSPQPLGSSSPTISTEDCSVAMTVELGGGFRYPCNSTMYEVARRACVAFYNGSETACIHHGLKAPPFWSAGNTSRMQWVYSDAVNGSSFGIGVYVRIWEQNYTNVTRICCGETLSPSNGYAPTSSPLPGEECVIADGQFGEAFIYPCNSSMFEVARLACIWSYNGVGVTCVHSTSGVLPFWSSHNDSKVDWVYVDSTNNESDLAVGVYIRTSNMPGDVNDTNLTRFCCSTTYNPTLEPTEAMTSLFPTISPTSSIGTSTPTQSPRDNPSDTPTVSTSVSPHQSQTVIPTAQPTSPVNTAQPSSYTPEACSTIVNRLPSTGVQTEDNVCLMAMGSILCDIEDDELGEICHGGIAEFSHMSCGCQTKIVEALSTAGVLCLGTVREIWAQLRSREAENATLQVSFQHCVPGYVE